MRYSSPKAIYTRNFILLKNRQLQLNRSETPYGPSSATPMVG